MIKKKHNGHTLLLYNSIEELPIFRFIQFQRFGLLDSGIGADLDSFDKRVTTLVQLIDAGNNDKAMKELINLRQCYVFMLQHVNPQMNAFVCLTYSIDGERVEDLSDDGIADTLRRLSRTGLTVRKVREWLAAAKKKFDAELETYFPSLANNIQVKTMYEKLLQRTRLVLQGIQSEMKTVEAKIRQIDKFLFDMIEPKIYSGSQGVEVNFLNSFEATCTLISQHTNQDPYQLTVHQFYSRLHFLKQQARQQKRKMK